MGANEFLWQTMEIVVSIIMLKQSFWDFRTFQTVTFDGSCKCVCSSIPSEDRNAALLLRIQSRGKTLRMQKLATTKHAASAFHKACASNSESASILPEYMLDVCILKRVCSCCKLHESVAPELPCINSCILYSASGTMTALPGVYDDQADCLNGAIACS